MRKPAVWVGKKAAGPLAKAFRSPGRHVKPKGGRHVKSGYGRHAETARQKAARKLQEKRDRNSRDGWERRAGNGAQDFFIAPFSSYIGNGLFDPPKRTSTSTSTPSWYKKRRDRVHGAPTKPTPRPRRGGCFVAGTMVKMADGTQKAIDQIRIGDVVLAFDEATQKLLPSPVTEVFVHENWERESGTVLVNGRVRATDNHPFFVNGEWKRADELRAGDWMFALPSGSAAATAVAPEAAATVESMPGADTVYNLEVATYHTYFAEGLLVHNMKTMH